MSGSAAVLKDVIRTWNSEISEPLNASTRRSLDRIYEVALGHFIERGLRYGQDVWKIAKFKRWNLINVAKIARETKRLAKGGRITPAAMEQAAVTVMKRAKKQCRVRFVNGRIRDIPGTRQEGDQCDSFLAAHK